MSERTPEHGPVTLFLCGDVMTGRGIDQILPRPVDPVIHEPYVRDARMYVELAEAANGPIPAPVEFDYIWGDALAELQRVRPDARVINLETSVTRSDDYWQGKGINYRMHPENIGCITAAGVDCCSLANNHVLDWGYPGLAETLQTLEAAGVRLVGAGRGLAQAQSPAVVEAGRGRIIVFGFGSSSSGIPPSWAASEGEAGVNLLADLSARTARDIGERVRDAKRTDDLVVASIHWGGNWGFGISREQIAFAHALIDQAYVDVVHGHSSHHVKAIEVYKGRLILYGCGDFLNDYEGIGGHEEYRSDLALMYFPKLERSSGRLVRLEMTPMRVRNFRVNRGSEGDASWVANTLTREGERFGTRLQPIEGARLSLHWG